MKIFVLNDTRKSTLVFFYEVKSKISNLSSSQQLDVHVLKSNQVFQDLRNSTYTTENVEETHPRKHIDYFKSNVSKEGS